MGVFSGPDTNESGLVLALDAANLKSYDKYENLITHSSMSGWVVGSIGSGGALPTGWVLDQQQPGSTITIIGGGIEDGLNYVDIRFSATSVTGSNRTLVRPGNAVSTDGSTYYLTSYSKLVAGSSTNLTHITFQGGNLSLTSTLTRNSGTSSVFTGTLFPRYDIGYNGTGVAYDITIRFVAPQLEKGSSATDYYATTGTAKTRGTTWIDLVSSSIGTLTNGPTYNTSNQGALVFDGTDDYVTNGVLSGSFASFTVITWFYPTVVVNYNNVLDCNSNHYSSGNIGPRLEMNSSGTLGWVYSNLTGDNSQFYFHDVVSSGLSANTWHCAAITYDGGTNNSITYYNGNSTGISRSVSGSPTGFVGSLNNLNIGRGFFNGRYFQGRISQTQIYNRALTASEIQQNFNATRSRFGI